MMTRAAFEMTPGICIVGNNPSLAGFDQEIDRFDHVTRFNNADGFGSRSGSRITELVLVSRGGQAQKWIDDRTLTAKPAVKAARSVTLVFPPTDDPGAECWFHELKRLLVDSGKEVNHISTEVHRHARESLNKLGAPRNVALSSGFLYTFSRLYHRELVSSPLHVYGFSFQGWDGHAWTAERAWFTQQVHKGLLKLHPMQKREP